MVSSPFDAVGLLSANHTLLVSLFVILKVAPANFVLAAALSTFVIFTLPNGSSLFVFSKLKVCKVVAFVDVTSNAFFSVDKS